MKMTPAETQYFALLRAALWGTPLPVNMKIDWKSVMQLAEYHGNIVLLSDVAAQMSDDNEPSSEMLDRMQRVMRSNLLHQMRLRQILIPAVQLLRQHSIEPVLLKGFGLALLYPNPSLRQFSDIDLFVGLEDFHEACTLLRSLPGSYNWGEEVDSGRHYNIEFGQYPMEIHRVSADVENAKDSAVYASIEREGLKEHLQHVSLDGFDISVPSKEFTVFFTFFHAWHHFLTTGVGWRQLSDLAMALHIYHNQLDMNKLHGWITAMQLMQPWQTFGYLLVQCLGLPETEMPFFDASCRRRAIRLYERIMKEGDFRRERKFKNHRPKRRLWQRIHAFIGIFIEFFHTAEVFPRQAFFEMLDSLRHGFEKKSKKK